MKYQQALHALSARRRWTCIASVVAVVALTLSGCGGSGDSSSASSSSSSSSSATGVAGVVGVVKAANSFLDTLSATQKKVAQLAFTKENAVAWSNLPCGTTCRPGIQFGKLSSSQLTAAKRVLEKALGTGSGTGYDQVKKILLADGVLSSAQGSGNGQPTGGTRPSGSTSGGAPNGGMPPSGMPSGAMPSGGMPSGGAAPSGGTAPGGQASSTNGQTSAGYGTGVYFLAFLGTPSATGTWELNFGGHHLAVHITFKGGKVVSSSPYFVGVEPKTWTAKDGTTYAPLSAMHDGMVTLLKSLSTAELTKAKLSKTYTDVLLGPGQDGKFPATKEGLAVSALSTAQKKLVMTAINPWISVVDDATATSLMTTYQSELDKTYLAYSGNTALTTHADYVRIDGPSVWVEFVCQNGVVYQNQIHYHTVYRDHTRDYGGEFSF